MMKIIINLIFGYKFTPTGVSEQDIYARSYPSAGVLNYLEDLTVLQDASVNSETRSE